MQNKPLSRNLSNPMHLLWAKKVQICVTECILIKITILNIVLTGKFSHLLVYLQSSSGAFQSIPPLSISFRQYLRAKLQEVFVGTENKWMENHAEGVWSSIM